MKFESPLVRAVLVKRYKRFFADVVLDSGEHATAHCPNTGTMKTCGEPGDIVYLSRNDNPKRKLRYTWELSKTTRGFVGVHTGRTNAIVDEAISKGAIAELRGYPTVQREVKHQASRLDFKLSSPDRPDCWVEVKNVTMIESDTCLFPDAVSARGLKHLTDLTEIAKSGQRAVMLFVVNRSAGRSFRPAKEIDPHYAKALANAHQHGVEVLVYRTRLSTTCIELADAVPWFHCHEEQHV